METKDFNIIDNIIAKLRLNKIKKYLDNRDIILDFGCGYQAYFLHSCKDIVKSGTGIDYEVKNQIIGKNINLINLRFIDKLPFPKHTFTKIFLLAVIEHFMESRIKKLLLEANRVLKPKGKVIITTPTPFSKPILEFLALKLHIISRAEIADHKKYYSKTDLEILARRTGFCIEEYNTFQLGINSLCVLMKTSETNF